MDSVSKPGKVSSGLSKQFRQTLLPNKEKVHLFNYITRTITPITLRYYRWIWQRFDEWAKENGKENVMSKDNIIGFGMFACKTCSKRTISTVVLSGLYFRGTNSGMIYSKTDKEEIHKALFPKSNAKHLGTFHEKRPIDKKTFDHMLGHLPVSISGKRDKALFLLSYYLLMRPSEIGQLSLEHVKKTRDSITITIPSKTKRPDSWEVISINKSTHGHIYQGLQDWLAYRTKIKGPVFTQVNKYGEIMEKQLQYSSVNGILKRRLKDIGADIENFSASSLRLGFMHNNKTYQ